ncbi:MAG: ATP-dependent Clp protease ATP-binding subunit [Ruminococcaceae bacterium]|nr:ATP-dependent Clp protease ATP-binding subunit [Oscillospiraceae bacterium]
MVLFDEIEKAHSDLHNLLLQIMDDGFVTTSRGKKISFAGSIIVLTSNATADLSASNSIPLGFEKKSADSDVQVYYALRKHFSPEFLGRINHTVVFNKLDSCCLKEICHKSIFYLKEKLAKQNITLETDENLTEFICKKSGISHSGARNISNTVAALLEDKISDMILSGRLSSGDTANVTVSDDKIVIKVYIKTK